MIREGGLEYSSLPTGLARLGLSVSTGWLVREASERNVPACIHVGFRT
jgi:hypothetical protein